MKPQKLLPLLALLALAAAPASLPPATPAATALFNGTTEPVAKVDVPAALKGIISEVNVKEGQPIKKGDALAKLDDDLQAAQVEFARLKAQDTTEIKAAQNQIDFAKNAYDTLQGRGSPAELREKELAYKQSQLSLEVQKQEQAQNQIKLKQEQITLEHMTLRSPIDGYVLRVHKQVGEQTDDGPVITVVQTSRLNAVFFLPRQYFGTAANGDHVNLNFDNGVSRQGVIVAVDPALDSGLFRVKFEVDNADAKIPAGIAASWALPKK